MTLGKYKYHFGLLEYRDAPLVERLSALRLDIQQPITSLCGFAWLLGNYISEAQIKSASVNDFHAYVESICSSLRELLEKTPMDVRSLSESEVQEALLLFWKRQDIVEAAFSLPDRMRTIQDKLRTVLPDVDFWLDSLSDTALKLWADIEVFANPGELAVPDHIVELEKSLRVLMDGEPRDPARLPELIEASQHEMPQFRDYAAGVLGNYTDEQSVDALIRLLNDEIEHIIHTAALSLGRIKNKKAVPFLIEALGQDFRDEGYRGAIVAALVQMPDERALDALIAVLDYQIGKPYDEQTLMPIRIARVRQAISAIGGPKAEEALKRPFGSTS